jgi:penicillin amidase
MVWFKRSLQAVGVLVGAGVVVSSLYVRSAFPVMDGVLHAPGAIAPIHIERDASDVTHIKAESVQDAWFALGYVHAQERGWQLEFNRRVMHGTLAEVLGAPALETDKLMRTLGIGRAAQFQWDGLPAEGREALQRYADGINAFNRSSSQSLPPEFHLLRIKPGTWTAQDSVGWSIMMALDLGGNWGLEFARLTAAQHLPTDRLWQLLAPYGKEAPAAKLDLAKLYAELGVYKPVVADQPKDAIKTGAAHAIPASANGLFDASLLAHAQDWSSQFVDNLGAVEGKGSNNWVVAGSNTVSGKPLLANDPHLGLSAPAIWYFASLQAPGLKVVGATFPGLPFVVLGRTEKVAWGVTNTGPDVQDLYLEQLHPNDATIYRVPDENGQTSWARFKNRRHVIKVKGQADVIFNARTTRHGPVITDAQKTHQDVLNTGKYVLALRWAALDSDNHTIMAGVRSNRAQSVAELKTALETWHSPMQNFVMADVDGAIAYKAAGRVPLRRADNDIMGQAPAPGWEPRYDWDGWIAAADTPEDDGAKGWIATANQKITPAGYKYFLGQDYALPHRFDRIEALLAATPKHDAASMRQIHADQLSTATQRLLPVLQKAQTSHPLGATALAQLKGFDAVMRADAAAPLIFAAWADEMARGLVEPKVGAAAFKSLYGKRHFRFTVEEALLGPDPWWCAPKTCDEQVNAALERALNRLQASYGPDIAQWQWGRAHVARSEHRPFSMVAPLNKHYEVRTPTGGDGFTVNVGQYWLHEEKTPFANRHAASMRTVFDLSNLENSQFIYQTGQSGLVFSSRYQDMAQAWADVRYRPLQLAPAKIEHAVTLTP